MELCFNSASGKRKRAFCHDFDRTPLYPFCFGKHGSLSPFRSNVQRLAARNHLDGLPGTILDAELASDANIEINFYKLLVLIILGAGNSKNAINGTKLDTDFTSRAARLINNRKLAGTLFRLSLGSRFRHDLLPV